MIWIHLNPCCSLEKSYYRAYGTNAHDENIHSILQCVCLIDYETTHSVNSHDQWRSLLFLSVNKVDLCPVCQSLSHVGEAACEWGPVQLQAGTELLWLGENKRLLIAICGGLRLIYCRRKLKSTHFDQSESRLHYKYEQMHLTCMILAGVYNPRASFRFVCDATLCTFNWGTHTHFNKTRHKPLAISPGL